MASNKINLIAKKKTVADKFVFISEGIISPQFYNAEEMEVRGLDKNKKYFKNYKGIAALSKKLNSSPAKIKKIIQTGIIKDKKLVAKISKEFTERKKAKINYYKEQLEKKHITKTQYNKRINEIDYKKESKQFTKHNFEKSNFFKRPKIRLKKSEEYFFRAGLKIIYERVKKVSTGVNENPRERKDMFYKIDNFPISAHNRNFNEGYNDLFEQIKFEIHRMPSFKHFSFNYFDVIVVDTSKFEHTKVKRTQTKKKK